MGFRFRRTMKIAPGLRLNLNKGSIGISAGPRGAKVSINSKGDKSSTLGLPGSGLSYTKRSSRKRKSTQNDEEFDLLTGVPDNMDSSETRIFLLSNIESLSSLSFLTKNDRRKF